MQKFIFKELINTDIKKELDNIGFDESYSEYSKEKFIYKTFKIFDLNSAQANILKQTALSVGADCGTNKNVITGNIEKSDVILTGSISQIKKIASKLKTQPFSLPVLSEELINALTQEKKKTKIAGILNVTPDSFSDGGKYIEPKDAIKHLETMIEEGADIIDIGAESTKPFSKEVSAEEQIKRLEPVLKYVNQNNLTIPISIDTRNVKVAKFCLDYGVKIINDVSGLDFDKNMAETIASYKAGVIIQHSKNTPDKMQINPSYENLMDEIFLFLKEKIKYAKSFGIEDIIIDPGIGFGKTREDNFEILNRIEEFNLLNCPIMVGISRKSMLNISNNLDNTTKDILSAAVTYPILQKGVDYIRVHNVKLHRQLLDLPY